LFRRTATPARDGSAQLMRDHVAHAHFDARAVLQRLLEVACA